MSPSSVGVTGVVGLSVRGEALATLVLEVVEGSPLAGPAGGSMVMAKSVQHRSLRRRRDRLVLKTVVSPVCERGARGGRGRGRWRLGVLVCVG